MKAILWLIMILILGLGVSGQTKADIIPNNERFTPNGIISISPHVGGQIETGTVNGVAYRYYYSDGSGTFEGVSGNGITPGAKYDFKQNWSVSCKKDPIDDSKYCNMSKADLSIFLFSKSGLYVSIGGNNYPGSDVAIRVDTQPATIGNEKAQFSGDKAKQIIDALKSGKQITTRYQKWPQGYDTTSTFDLSGFNEAFQFINWAFGKIK